MVVLNDAVDVNWHGTFCPTFSQKNITVTADGKFECKGDWMHQGYLFVNGSFTGDSWEALQELFNLVITNDPKAESFRCQSSDDCSKYCAINEHGAGVCVNDSDVETKGVNEYLYYRDKTAVASDSLAQLIVPPFAVLLAIIIILSVGTVLYEKFKDRLPGMAEEKEGLMSSESDSSNDWQPVPPLTRARNKFRNKLTPHRKIHPIAEEEGAEDVDKSHSGKDEGTQKTTTQPSEDKPPGSSHQANANDNEKSSDAVVVEEPKNKPKQPKQKKQGKGTNKQNTKPTGADAGEIDGKESKSTNEKAKSNTDKAPKTDSKQKSNEEDSKLDASGEGGNEHATKQNNNEKAGKGQKKKGKAKPAKAQNKQENTPMESGSKLQKDKQDSQESSAELSAKVGKGSSVQVQGTQNPSTTEPKSKASGKDEEMPTSSVPKEQGPKENAAKEPASEATASNGDEATNNISDTPQNEEK
ncbi:hypothetical protein DICA1_B08724 [Diutina catenulata]